jgi:hypothetical protein
MMRKSLWLVLAVLVVIGAPVAKADSFVYNVTSTVGALDVTFELPTFQEFVTTTTFTHNSSAGGPLTSFTLSGNTTVCSDGFVTFTGPCFQGMRADGSGFGTPLSPGFTGPGTFTSSSAINTTTVTITDVPSGVPEPSSLALVPLGLVALLLMRKRAGHFRPSGI